MKSERNTSRIRSRRNRMMALPSSDGNRLNGRTIRLLDVTGRHWFWPVECSLAWAWPRQQQPASLNRLWICEQGGELDLVGAGSVRPAYPDDCLCVSHPGSRHDLPIDQIDLMAAGLASCP
jgi:hypothetical protein